MTNQPSDPSLANSGTKKCWSCDATTPYAIGWCQECWDLMPIAVQSTVLLLVDEAQPWRGAIYMAIATSVRQIRQPRPVPREPRVLTELSLDDLDFNDGE